MDGGDNQQGRLLGNVAGASEDQIRNYLPAINLTWIEIYSCYDFAIRLKGSSFYAASHTMRGFRLRLS